MDEDMAVAATDTLYTKCICESVFGLLSLLFLAVEVLLCRDPCLMLIFAVSW